jgi:uncharacterized FAD-dependent dehydrogenase
MSQSGYDVIIVGAGPAGIFAALELTQSARPRVLMLDKGPELEKRHCPSREAGHCMQCATCALMTGWGGSGAFSDGKLTLTTQVGGLLAEIRGEREAEELVREVDDVWVRFGANGEPYEGDLDRIEEVARQASLVGMRLQHYPIRHLGTERSGDILGAMYHELVSRGVEVRTRTEVAQILTSQGVVNGVETARGEMLNAPYVVVAPGREGADWLADVARTLELSLSINPVDIGVRVELPAHVLAPLTDLLYEPKFLFFSSAFDDRVRTFCVCPYGEVVTEWAGDVMTVNGHSYAETKTDNTNFAVLVSKNFTEPFKEPTAYGKYIARLANLLSGGIIVQRLGDLRAGRRTTDQRLERCITRPTLTEATPGDLNLVLPHRYVVNILEMLVLLVAPQADPRPGDRGAQSLCRR